MRWVCLIAMLLAIPATLGSGQEGGSARATDAVTGGQAAPTSTRAPAAPTSAPLPAATTSVTVKVYEPSSTVKEPLLLPLSPVPPVTKICEQRTEGEVLLSLLVDTSGRARNVMFLKPAGSALDRVAIHIAEQDRFEPGTLDGKAVVVAEALRIKLKGCDQPEVTAQDWMLRSMPAQKLEKPKDPPEEAILAPQGDEGSGTPRTVTRPDFFGGEVSAPVLLYSEEAAYPPLLQAAQISDTCELGLVVDRHGLPENVHVIKSVYPGFDISATRAVNMYRFFPAIRNGKEPVPAAIVVSVTFGRPGAAADE